MAYLKGKQINYFKNGNIQAEIIYKNDALEGVTKTYYNNKQLRELVTFADNLRNGAYQKYKVSGAKLLKLIIRMIVCKG